MEKVPKYTRVVLALLAGFVLFCAGWFGHQFNSPQPYQVTVRQRPAAVDISSGDTSEGESAKPDSLLPGETININTADIYDLQRLPGIGEKRAQDIMDYRAEHGSFQTVDELDNVSGIGPGILEGLREFVSVE